MVQAGVYDVVTDLDGLKAVPDRPQASLAAAALGWTLPGPWLLQPGTGAERIVGAGGGQPASVLIVVAGVTSGVGTTTVAFALAGYWPAGGTKLYWRRQGNSVAWR